MKKATSVLCVIILLAITSCKKQADAAATQNTDTTMVVKTPPPAVETPDTWALDSAEGTSVKTQPNGVSK